MRKSPSFKKYVILSVFLHFAVVGGFYLVSLLKAKDLPQQTVDIDFLTPEQIQQFTKAEKTLAGKKVPQMATNQVVEQSEISANEEVVDTRFLSAKNQKVKKQTIAAQRGKFQNQKSPKSGAKGDGRKASQKEVADSLFKGFDANSALSEQRTADLKSGLGEGRGENQDSSENNSEVSQSNDYIKDVDRGLETLLNTREFKYYSYYNRIRRQLSQHWEGRVRHKLSKMFQEGRAPAAASRDRITKLMIVLNDKGTLVRVQVLSDSGIRDLDDAAIEAFRAAAPFPNPPKGIVEGDGTVKIRWDFVLET